jgi:hypothetical protein
MKLVSAFGDEFYRHAKLLSVLLVVRNLALEALTAAQ